MAMYPKCKKHNAWPKSQLRHPKMQVAQASRARHFTTRPNKALFTVSRSCFQPCAKTHPIPHIRPAQAKRRYAGWALQSGLCLGRLGAINSMTPLPLAKLFNKEAFKQQSVAWDPVQGCCFFFFFSGGFVCQSHGWPRLLGPFKGALHSCILGFRPHADNKLLCTACCAQLHWSFWALLKAAKPINCHLPVAPTHI